MLVLTVASFKLFAFCRRTERLAEVKGRVYIYITENVED